MADADLNVRLRVVRDKSLKRALNGIVEETKKAEKSARSDSKKTASERKRQLREHSKNIQQAARRAQRIIKREEEAQRKEIRRTNRERQEGMVKATREGVKRSRRLLASAGAGVFAGGAYAARRAQQLTGAPSVEQGIEGAIEFGQQLIRLGSQASLTADAQEKLRDSIIEASNATNISAVALLQGVDKAQEKFSDPSIVTDNLVLFGQTANALNTEVSDVVNAVGQFTQNLRVAKEDIPSIIGAMEQAQREGAITVNDIASTFAQSIGLYGSVTGQRGAEGSKNFLATAQVLGAGGANREQVRTQFEALLTELNRGATRKKLGKAVGRDLVSGTELDIAAIVEKLAASKITAQGVGQIFGSSEAVKAIVTLVEQTRVNAGSPLRQIAAVEGGKGVSAIQEANAALVGSTSGQALAKRNLVTNNYITNTENLIDIVTKYGGAMEELKSQYPLMTEAVKAATVAVTAFGAAAVLGGGVGGLAGKGAKTAAAIAGVGRGAGRLVAGGLGKIGAIAGGGAAAGGAVLASGVGGYAFGTFLNKQLDLENKIADIIDDRRGTNQHLREEYKPLAEVAKDMQRAADANARAAVLLEQSTRKAASTGRLEDDL